MDNIEQIIFIELCPFCQTIPQYNEQKGTVHCTNIECAIGDFHIDVDKWNKRATNGD